MAWHAKPSGAYNYKSDEAKDNFIEFHSILSSYGFNDMAVCGIWSNIYIESGFNPFRWQSDTVNYSGGYGLPQFTPATSYIGGVGVGVDGYAPNLSTSEWTTGASATDGKAQSIVMAEDRAGKFINRSSYCNWFDISYLYPLSNFKNADTVYHATIGWFFHYEGSAIALSGTASQQKTQCRLRYTAGKYAYKEWLGLDPGESGERPPNWLFAKQMFTHYIMRNMGRSPFI